MYLNQLTEFGGGFMGKHDVITYGEIVYWETRLIGVDHYPTHKHCEKTLIEIAQREGIKDYKI